jgi:uncharacterized protein
MTLSLLISAVLMGLMGAGHCAAMCGPITIAFVARVNPSQRSRSRQPIAAHIGRITAYAAIGALVASFSAVVTNLLRNEFLQTAWLLLPNLLLMLSALYLMGFRETYAPIESAGRLVWRSLSSARGWITSHGGVGGDFARGAIWGMMPCGMIYSALGLAVLAAYPIDGAIVMAIFGASTLPVLLAIGLLSSSAVKRIQAPTVRRCFGIALLVLVIWNLYLLPQRLQGVRFAFFC